MIEDTLAKSIKQTDEAIALAVLAQAKEKKLREALEAIVEIADEEHHIRPDSARLYEIRTYAMCALKEE